MHTIRRSRGCAKLNTAEQNRIANPGSCRANGGDDGGGGWLNRETESLIEKGVSVWARFTAWNSSN